jgi:hypothetical protein
MPCFGWRTSLILVYLIHASYGFNFFWRLSFGKTLKCVTSQVLLHVEGKGCQTFTSSKEVLERIESDLASVVPKIVGTDSNGNKYSGLIELWKLMSHKTGKRDTENVDWYRKASEYFEDEQKCPKNDGNIFSLFCELPCK